MTDNLSEKTVANLQPPAKGNKVHYFAGDKIQGKAAPRGFGVRITSAGAKSFIINYRIGSSEHRYTIGRYPDWSVLKAVVEARSVRQRIDRGEDPLAKREAARSAPTMKELWTRYENEHLPRKRPSSQRDDKSIWANNVKPKIGSRKVDGIEFSDIDKLHRDLAGKPIRANRTVALLSKMFSLAIRWQMRSDNPCRSVERYPENKRKRYLTGPELTRLTKALAEYENQKAANIVRLCLLTGCRRGEALGARWDQFDLDAGYWTKPGATTKQKTDHRAPLSDAAVALLKNILADAERDDDDKLVCEFVFPGRTNDAPLSEIKDEWDDIRTAAKIPDVRLHDLRHTYASILASAGKSLTVIGALLGHTQAQTTARYAHLFDDPLKEATNAVGNVVTGVKSAEVTPIRRESAI